MKTLLSTADGQRRLFWDSHASLAQTNNARMAEIQFNCGVEDAKAKRPPRLPNIPEYMAGYSSES